MQLEIHSELLKNAAISEEEFRLELAIFLFEKKIFTLGKASELAGLPQLIFQRELAKREIPVHYGYDDFREDLAAAKQLKETL